MKWFVIAFALFVGWRAGEWVCELTEDSVDSSQVRISKLIVIQDDYVVIAQRLSILNEALDLCIVKRGMTNSKWFHHICSKWVMHAQTGMQKSLAIFYWIVKNVDSKNIQKGKS